LRGATIAGRMDGPIDDAACVGKDWWPWPRTRTDRARLWAAARAVCAECPSRYACALMALNTPFVHGCWAGVRCSVHGQARNADVDQSCAASWKSSLPARESSGSRQLVVLLPRRTERLAGRVERRADRQLIRIDERDAQSEM